MLDYEDEDDRNLREFLTLFSQAIAMAPFPYFGPPAPTFDKNDGFDRFLTTTLTPVELGE